ncbi:PREDICTED: sialic acid-binding Ig-like lectin 13 [Cyprinodon variegatus]|uniref:sialic acid-binding Ig-like lectin 13 n=1 Tax=Cyprinodon variegatus TaxID=28743 RepID=UPI000742881F|nr:PREDICTED: sialic acid-binding Ig-like lectin 13 [Cyprinodon variegatus]
MKDRLNLMAALSENMLIVNMLVGVFFLPGTLAKCDRKPDLRITTPKKIEALSGSCLEIPCIYDTEHTSYDSSRTIYGVWMKGGHNFVKHPNIVIFNSSGSVNNYSLNITGNLREKNCTTLFPDVKTSYTDEYFFRIENEPFKASACDDPLIITVKDSSWSPSINISVGDLKEHQSVTISCSAVTPCPHSPPELTWNLQQDSERQTETNPDGTFTTTETELTLSVSYAPKDTSASISPSGLVSAGSWVELSCSSRAKPPASFTWFRNSKHGAINVSEGQVYNFTVTEGGEYYCEATNDLGTQRSSMIFLTSKDGFLVPIAVGISVVILLILCLVVFVW